MKTSFTVHSMTTRMEYCSHCMKQVIGRVVVYTPKDSENKWETVTCSTCNSTISDVLK